MAAQIMAEVTQTKSRKIPTKARYDMHWEMNRRCNFNCAYCFRQKPDADRRSEDPDCARYSTEHIAQRFDEIGKPWRIRMTGGEPFLYPDFVELARLLTRAHYISVSTNLSTPNTYDFADAVEPDRVALINANLHIMEREKSVNGVRKYLQKFLFFQERGFNINLVYVTYPPLLGRIAEDIKWWRGQGVRSIVVKVFQGKFQDKRYSRDYTDEERSLLRGLGLNNCEEEILARRVSFLGTKCQAGHLAFAMDISGNVTRCTSLKEDYGNLFDGTFVPGKVLLRCTARKCACTYEGIHFAASKGSLTPSHYVVKSTRFCIAMAERLHKLTWGNQPQPPHAPTLTGPAAPG